jgi:hypothetical protein
MSPLAKTSQEMSVWSAFDRNNAATNGYILRKAIIGVRDAQVIGHAVRSKS